MRGKYLVAALSIMCVRALSAVTPVASATFEGGEQGRILVQAKINGKGPYPFIFDTGSVNILSLDVANQLGITVSGKQQIDAFGGSVESASAVLESITVGDVTMSRNEVLVIGGGPFTNGGPVGFLGWQFLLKLVVEVDYQHGVLNFYNPETYTYPGLGARVPVTTSGNLILIPARIYGQPASIELDSGNENSALVLFRRFVAEHQLHSNIQAITGYGFGGLTRAMVTRAPALVIGDLEIRSPLVHLSVDTSGVEGGNFDIDGNLGAPILREFTCIYDLPHKAVYLEPNTWFNKPELDDHSGLVLDTRRAVAEVLYVYPGSPAAQAGITAGDQLAAGNGKGLPEDQWHDSLDAPPGTVVYIQVNHHGQRRKISLTLRSYL
jgi:hypothetical protein